MVDTVYTIYRYGGMGLAGVVITVEQPGILYRFSSRPRYQHLLEMYTLREPACIVRAWSTQPPPRVRQTSIHNAGFAKGRTAERAAAGGYVLALVHSAWGALPDHGAGRGSVVQRAYRCGGSDCSQAARWMESRPRRGESQPTIASICATLTERRCIVPGMSAGRTA